MALKNSSVNTMKEKIFYDADRAVKTVTLGLLDPGVDSTRFLDCGPGNCAFTRELIQALGSRDNYAAENAESRLKLARSLGMKLIECDFNKGIPCPDAFFDVVHAGQIIEHLNDTDKFVEELYRIIKPGGYCILSTPNLASWHNILWLAMGKQPHVAMVSDRIIRWKLADGEEMEPKHRRVFTGEGLAMLLNYHRFTVERIRGAGFYPLMGEISRAMSILDRWHSAYVVIKVRKEEIRR